MNAHQNRAKSQTEPTARSLEEDSVVRSSCGTLKGMVFGFEGGIVGSTHGDNEAQHGNRVDLEITQSLNQTFDRSINFHHALHKLFLGAVQ